MEAVDFISFNYSAWVSHLLLKNLSNCNFCSWSMSGSIICWGAKEFNAISLIKRRPPKREYFMWSMKNSDTFWQVITIVHVLWWFGLYVKEPTESNERHANSVAAQLFFSWRQKTLLKKIPTFLQMQHLLEEAWQNIQLDGS